MRQVVRYALHLAAVYLIAHFTSLWLAAFVHNIMLPLLRHPSDASRFEFAFSHLFVFSFFPAAIIAFLNLHWSRHGVALSVWIVPAVILAYQFLTFPTSVMMDNRFVAAFHHFFAGGFFIPEYHNYEELFQLMGNPDLKRGFDQMNYTAPLYAAIGYVLGAWIALRYPIARIASLRYYFGWKRPEKSKAAAEGSATP
jgi:hypothetical protein